MPSKPRLWELALEDGIVCGLGHAAHILVTFRWPRSRHAAGWIAKVRGLLFARILIVVLHKAAACGEDIINPSFAAVLSTIFTHGLNYLSFGLLFQFHRGAQVRGARARGRRESDNLALRPRRVFSRLIALRRADFYNYRPLRQDTLAKRGA